LRLLELYLDAVLDALRWRGVHVQEIAGRGCDQGADTLLATVSSCRTKADGEPPAIGREMCYISAIVLPCVSECI